MWVGASGKCPYREDMKRIIKTRFPFWMSQAEVLRGQTRLYSKAAAG